METSNQFLGTERIGKLMKQYAVPCIVSLLVGALYNSVDQIFIANASYLGSYGNAANTVVFPLTVVALAIAVMIGDGCCAYVSICLGRQEVGTAKRSVGNAVVMAVSSGAVLAQLLYRRAPADRRPVLQYGTLVSNSGILGTVIAEGIFGSLGVLYAPVYVIPQRIIMWTLGVSYFEGTSDKKAALRRVALNPCVLAVAAGLVIMLAQLHLPAVVSLTIKNVAGGNTMCAMMLVGTVLAQTDLKTIAEGQVLRYCAVRLLLRPGLTLLACRLAGVDGLVTSVAVVLSGTPAPTTVSALATKYGVGEQLAAKCVVSSTLLSLATIPLWCLLIR